MASDAAGALPPESGNHSNMNSAINFRAERDMARNLTESDVTVNMEERNRRKETGGEK